MSLAEQGIRHINEVVNHFAKTYPKKEMFLLDSSGSFSECLAMSIIVRHLMLMMPSAVLLWGVPNRYHMQWEPYTKEFGSIIFPFPDNPTNEDRIAWRDYAKTLELGDVQFPGLGITRAGIGFVKNFILNAGITKMLVRTIPLFPHDIKDTQWHDNLAVNGKFGGRPYIAIEYKANDERIDLIAKKTSDIIWIGEKDDKQVSGIDARGCTMRQAKIVVMRAKAFISCTSDYQSLALCNGVTTKTFDITSGSPLAILGQANSLCQQPRRR